MPWNIMKLARCKFSSYAREDDTGYTFEVLAVQPQFQSSFEYDAFLAFQGDI
jgi:hypothetical protein